MVALIDRGSSAAAAGSDRQRRARHAEEIVQSIAGESRRTGRRNAGLSHGSRRGEIGVGGGPLRPRIVGPGRRTSNPAGMRGAIPAQPPGRMG
jgi:hypothetical protein